MDSHLISIPKESSSSSPPSHHHHLKRSFSDTDLLGLTEVKWQFRWRRTAGFVGFIDLILAVIYLGFLIGTLLYRTIVGQSDYKDAIYGVIGVCLLCFRILLSWRLVQACRKNTQYAKNLEIASSWTNLSLTWLPASVLFMVATFSLLKDPDPSDCEASQDRVFYLVLIEFTMSLVLRIGFLCVVLMFSGELRALLETTIVGQEELPERSRFAQVFEKLKKHVV